MHPLFSGLDGSGYHLVLEVGLSPDDIVLDGYPMQLPPERGTAATTFRPIALARIPASRNFTHNAYCQLGNARRTALVAILPDNCHPSSYAPPLRSRCGHYYGRLWNRADQYILPCGFFYLSFFSSPKLSDCRLDVYHTSTHGVALVQI